MRKSLSWISVLALFTSAFAFAGGGSSCSSKQAVKTAKASQGTCSASAQKCLDYKMASFQDKGWLGVKTESIGKGYYAKITQVESHSPAAEAGFKAGDILVAVNGVYLSEENAKKIKKAKAGMIAGSEVMFTVKRDGEKQQIAATLAKMPAHVMAAQVGEHMLNYHAKSEVVAANN